MINSRMDAMEWLRKQLECDLVVFWSTIATSLRSVICDKAQPRDTRYGDAGCH